MFSPEWTMTQVDPYQNYRFVLSWDGHAVAGVSRVSGLGEGVSTKDLPITLHRGVTHDAAFARWANATFTPTNDIRKDFNLALFDDARHQVVAYNLYRCWASEVVAMPELDGGGSAIVIETLVLQLQGWDRSDSNAR
jgi:hypothetical protein